MKGPSGRLRHQVLRLWQCPVCQRREHTGGDVVTRTCDCLSQTQPPRWTWMRLIEDEPGQPAPETQQP
jgi:hypothetical protein